MWGQEDTKYKLLANFDTFWPWAIYEIIWSWSPDVCIEVKKVSPYPLVQL